MNVPEKRGTPAQGITQHETYICEYCGHHFTKPLYSKEYGAEIGVILYCPYCKEETTGRIE